MNVGKFLTGWFMVTLILVLASAGAFINRDTILALASTIQARFNPPTLTTGLVGYWSFNGADVSGSTAYDRSGQGNDGTLVNSPAKASGKSGQGLNFDGDNDYVTASSPASLDDIPRLTVSVWIKADTIGENPTTNRIVSKADDGFSFGWILRTCSNDGGSCSGASNNIVFVYAFNGGTPGRWRTPANSLTYGDWIHVTVTYDNSSATNDPIIYLNGVPATVTEVEAPTGSALTNASEDLLIGNRSDTAQTFDGVIDEVRVYNRILSAGEVKQLYNQGVGSKISTAQGDTVTEGLIGYWPLDASDISGTTLYDRSASGINGTMTTNPKVRGVLNQGLGFRTGSHPLAFTSAAAFDNMSQFTGSFWIKSANFFTDNGQPYLLAKQSGSGQGWWVRVCDDGGGNCDQNRIRFTRAFTGTDGVWATPAGVLKEGPWQHIVVSYDSGSTTNDPVIYINGVAQSLTEVSTPTLVADNDAGDEIVFGAGGASLFTGEADEIRLYNRILTQEEVLQLYHQGEGSKANVSQNDELTNGLVGLWSFDGPDITDRVYDRSGQGSNGYFSGGATSSAKVSGKVGQALTFDGVNDHVSMGAPSALNLTGSLTTSAWIYPTSFGGGNRGRIIDKQANATNGYLFLIDNQNTTASFGLGVDAGIFGGNSYRAAPANSIQLNTWQFVTAVFDGTNVSYYVNGIEVGSAQPLNPPSTGSNNFVIGGRTTDNARNFDGKIDEVRIYNRALSADEIMHLYNKGR